MERESERWREEARAGLEQKNQKLSSQNDAHEIGDAKVGMIVRKTLNRVV